MSVNGSLDLICIGEGMVELSSLKETAYATEFTKAYAGDALNTAVAAKRLGNSVGFITGFGDDPFAHGLRQLCQSEGLDTSGAKVFAGEQTGLYLVGNPVGSSSAEDDKKEYLYYRKGSAASKLSPQNIDPNMIATARMVHSTAVTLSLSESARKTVHRAFEIAKANNVMTVFDPNFRPRLWDKPMDALEAINDLLPLVDVILPSIPDDTLPTIGLSRPEQVADYFWFKEVPLVVVKAGHLGCYIGYKKKIEHVAAFKAERVVDTVGAGDTFNAGFIHGLLTNQSLVDCGRLGATAAGLMIQQRGVINALPMQEAIYSRTPMQE